MTQKRWHPNTAKAYQRIAVKTSTAVLLAQYQREWETMDALLRRLLLDARWEKPTLRTLVAERRMRSA